MPSKAVLLEKGSPSDEPGGSLSRAWEDEGESEKKTQEWPRTKAKTKPVLFPGSHMNRQRTAEAEVAEESGAEGTCGAASEQEALDSREAVWRGAEGVRAGGL